MNVIIEKIEAFLQRCAADRVNLRTDQRSHFAARVNSTRGRSAEWPFRLETDIDTFYSKIFAKKFLAKIQKMSEKMACLHCFLVSSESTWTLRALATMLRSPVSQLRYQTRKIRPNLTSCIPFKGILCAAPSVYHIDSPTKSLRPKRSRTLGLVSQRTTVSDSSRLPVGGSRREASSTGARQFLFN